MRDAAVHAAVLEKFMNDAAVSGFTVENVTWSPVKGPEGNIEFLGHLVSSGEAGTVDIAAVVDEAHNTLV